MPPKKNKDHETIAHLKISHKALLHNFVMQQNHNLSLNRVLRINHIFNLFFNKTHRVILLSFTLENKYKKVLRLKLYK